MRELVQVASADEDLQCTFNSLDTLGFNLLHYSCMYRLNNLIPVLISKGASVNQQTSFGSTALHLATSMGNVEAVDLLLANGAIGSPAPAASSSGSYHLHGLSSSSPTTCKELAFLFPVV